MNFEVTIASQKALHGYLKKNTALSKSQATDAVKARKRGVKNYCYSLSGVLLG
jgi:hypothetical protein